MGEHLPCKQGVVGSNPFISTHRMEIDMMFCPMKIAYKRKVFSKELEKILRLNFYFLKFNFTGCSENCSKEEET